MNANHRVARLLLEAVAHLANHGYGRLRIFCYIKEGLGVWRYMLFASDEFSADGPNSSGLRSIPGWEPERGETVQAVAAHLLQECPKLMQDAAGPPGDYGAWLLKVLEEHPDGVLEMETPKEASIGGRTVRTPF